MSGTVGGSVIGSSRGTGVIGGQLLYRFTSGTSVLHIPESASTVVIECIGGGGSGAGGSGYKREGGSGGGGGALARMSFPADSLTGTLTITVGAGGAAPSPQGHGVFGAATTVTYGGRTILSAYGGGGGTQGTSNDQTMTG